MKYIAILFLLALSSVAYSTTYYISPNGNDSNNGTITAPFFTLNKAWSVLQPGDIIYARGGVYRFNSQQRLTGKSGTASDTIRIWSYPGERPVFTKGSSFSVPSFPVSLIYIQASYIHIRGIEVAYFTQATSSIWYGIAAQNSNHNKYERINSHHNGDGMVLRDGDSDNLILNCDFHHNSDPLTVGDPYGNADGLAVAYQPSTARNTIKGCRFWNNSDDGLDLWYNDGYLTLENSWSWKNGYKNDGTPAADGCGFKFGATEGTYSNQFGRTVINNIAVYNKTKGFNQNSANVKFYFYNNVAWKNAKGFDFYIYDLQHVFKNNVVFDNTVNWNGTYSNSIKDHNSYDASFSPNGPVASAADFQSLDTTGMSGPRKADGSLPDIKFMKLVSTSDLINAGTNVGLPYEGSAPDLGAFEFRSSTTTTPPPTPTPAAAPVYQGSVIKGSNSSEIDITYNADLSANTPATSAFAVIVNSVARNVTKVVVSGKEVYLTLVSPVKYGDKITFSYTQPAENPLQGTTGSKTVSLSDIAVTNSVKAKAPKYLNAVVKNDTPDKLVMTYDIPLASVTPQASSFIATINGEQKTITAVNVAESQVNLTLPVNLSNNDTISITYNPPDQNPLQSVEGGVAEPIAAKPVENEVQKPEAGGEELINGGKFLIFPNPAKDFIKIANLIAGTEVPVLKLYDISGKLCQEIKLEDMGKMRKIPIDLKPGFYVAQVVSGSVVNHVQKLIVVK
jgi:uncharacterized repeat protein (TIGR02059 family)